MTAHEAIIAGIDNFRNWLGGIFGGNAPQQGSKAQIDHARHEAEITAKSRTPQFATGGIVKGPVHALIGESGPEAVIPLTKKAEAGSELARAASKWLSSGVQTHMADGGIAIPDAAQGAQITHYGYKPYERRTKFS